MMMKNLNTLQIRGDHNNGGDDEEYRMTNMVLGWQIHEDKFIIETVTVLIILVTTIVIVNIKIIIFYADFIGALL